MDPIIEIVLALVAGGASTAAIKGILDRKKVHADADKAKAEGDATLIEVAMKMTDRFQQSIISLEARTENLSKSNIKLENELLEIKRENLNLTKDIELLKSKNYDLDKTCAILMRENTELKLELENCIKKG
jgi:predicted RNase H-like nuclease (RuvC/YqgF family)